MSPETLEAIFVQREKLAERQIELIRDSSLTPRKHYSLLIGPRGIGKTHLVSLIYHRVMAMEDLKGRLVIAWLREEEWGVSSFLDLLLRICHSLKSEEQYEELQRHIQPVYEMPAEGAEERVREALKQFVGNRTVLVIVENFDEVLNGLGDEGQKRLRAFLQENPFCAILATAPSLFDAVSLRTSPFYGFFRINHLESLRIEEATLLLEKVAELQEDKELADFIPTPAGRARIRSLHHLAGGNHRVYIIFSQFLSRESLDELVEPFMQTLDDLTPYYQERIRWLSPQQRRIIEFLCDCRYATTVKEIAKRCLMTHQTASGQLKGLRDKSYVKNEMVGRESYYELCEPLMRLCVELKKNRGEPIRLFVDFLRLWYTREELEQRLKSIRPEAAFEREYVMEAIRVSQEEPQDPRVAACLRDLKGNFEKVDFGKALEVAEELVAIRGNSEDWFRRSYCLDQLEQYEESLAALDKAIELNPGNLLTSQNLPVLMFHGVVLWRLKRYQETLAVCEKVIELDPKNLPAWKIRGAALVTLERHPEALEAFKKVIELDPEDSEAWNNHGAALAHLGRYEEALASCETAIRLGEADQALFFNRAEFLLALHRSDEGISALDDALQRFAHAKEPKSGDTPAILCNLLTRTSDPSIWREQARTLLGLYKKHDVLAALGQGLVHSIRPLKSEMISSEAARVWLNLWQELAGGFKEFEIPLRLLDVGVRYLESKDPRVLLGLAAEERSLLAPLVED